MKKITQIDFQIMMLEEMGPKISAIEKCKLDNLREQKCLMQKSGIELKPTMVPKFPSRPNTKRRGSCVQPAGQKNAESLTKKPVSDVETKATEVVEQVSINEDEVSKSGAKTDSQVKSGLHEKKNKVKSGGGPSAYLMFLHHEREQLNKKNPGDKLDLPSLRQTWSKMSESEKKVFQEMANLKKDSLGQEFHKEFKIKSLSVTEKKLRRKTADKKYRESRSQEQSVKKEEEDSLKERLKEVIIRKEEELDQMVNYVDNLKSEIGNIQKKKKEAIDKVVEKDVEIVVMKEQYKALHKIHKSCNKEDA